jgi:hypothetical protein
MVAPLEGINNRRGHAVVRKPDILDGFVKFHEALVEFQLDRLQIRLETLTLFFRQIG